jgi:hypothetical protein
MRPKSGSSHQTYGPPRRIKRDDTKDLFPSLAIDSLEQRKLFKIAESIGGLASQLASDSAAGLHGHGHPQPQSSSHA